MKLKRYKIKFKMISKLSISLWKFLIFLLELQLRQTIVDSLIIIRYLWNKFKSNYCFFDKFHI